jgi:hypothetical protein
MNTPSVFVAQDSSNIVLGSLAGLGAAFLGAAIWAAITVFTGYQIGWMAVGVGFLVGISVRQFGRGRTPLFAVTGAVLALAGCVIGNALAIIGFHANQNTEPFFGVLMQVDPAALTGVMVETADPMDLLFYAIAVYEGFKLSVLPAAQEASPSPTS